MQDCFLNNIHLVKFDNAVLDTQWEVLLSKKGDPYLSGNTDKSQEKL